MFEKMFEKKFAKKVRKYYKLSEGRGGEGWGGCRIVIPMPEAINFVDGRRQKSRPVDLDRTFNRVLHGV
jgi:hypothetical protein